MKVNMQVIFKTGSSLQGVTHPEDFDKFIKSFSAAKLEADKEGETPYFEIRDHLDGRNHAILVNLSDVNAMAFEEQEEIEAPKMTEEELHNLDVVGNKE